MLGKNSICHRGFYDFRSSDLRLSWTDVFDAEFRLDFLIFFMEIVSPRRLDGVTTFRILSSVVDLFHVGNKVLINDA